MKEVKFEGKIKLRKDDQVEVIAGKDKGKTGKILKVDRTKGRVLVQGLNMVKKARKAKKQDEKSGIIEIESAVHVSNIMIICRKCGPTRIGYKLVNESKTRICRKCGEAL
ncbi:MAG: 50S ribosomal protein L24 [Spirochaetales bacterium]|nr:MAG: 50S ribosomal protein L24 [Spirochaetales bacterium]